MIPSDVDPPEDSKKSVTNIFNITFFEIHIGEKVIKLGKLFISFKKNSDNKIEGNDNKIGDEDK